MRIAYKALKVIHMYVISIALLAKVSVSKMDRFTFRYLLYVQFLTDAMKSRGNNMFSKCAIKSGAPSAIILMHSCLGTTSLPFVGLIAVSVMPMLLRFAHVQAFILLLMYVEATVVITNQKSHFRVLRALRVIFFIDTYIMVGVRRLVSLDQKLPLFMCTCGVSRCVYIVRTYSITTRRKL